MGIGGPNLNVRVPFKCRFLVFITQYFFTQNMNLVTEYNLPFHPDVFTLISVRAILSPSHISWYLARDESLYFGWVEIKNFFYYSEMIMEMYV